ncbi:DUF2254 domain-containing protein [soil metagenome]
MSQSPKDANGGLRALTDALTDSVRRRWSILLSGYWFVPGVTVLLISGLARVLLAVDRDLAGSGRQIGFAGGPDSARALLSAIASSTLTLTALVFSITIVALQLASSQFSPRVLRTFLRDHRSQVTLGIFLGTFVHGLLVLREVRGVEGSADLFVPGLSIFASFGLVIVSVGFFVQYIHHIAGSIRVIEIISRIFNETIKSIDRCHPQDPDDDAGRRPPAHSPTSVVEASSQGVVTAIDLKRLANLAEEAQVTLAVVPRAGDFVAKGMPLVEVFGSGDVDESRVRSALALSRERDLAQDPAFGFRQLVDIAERSLSPGINDPTTATQCLDHIHALLRHLAPRQLTARTCLSDDGFLLATADQSGWEDYVRLGLDEIRHWGAGSLQVHRRIEDLLADLITVTPPDRLGPLTEQRRLLGQRREDLPAAERNR